MGGLKSIAGTEQLKHRDRDRVWVLPQGRRSKRADNRLSGKFRIGSDLHP